MNNSFSAAIMSFCTSICLMLSDLMQWLSVNGVLVGSLTAIVTCLFYAINTIVTCYCKLHEQPEHKHYMDVNKFKQ